MTPAKRRLLVVGAGIVGAAIADRFAAAGAEVTLVDAGSPGAGTSETSLGWINASRKQPRSYFEFSVASMEAWRRLAAEFDNPWWYVPTGDLIWAHSDEDRAELEERLTRLQSWGYRAETVTANHALELEPSLRPPAGATVAYFPDEAFAHAGAAAAALTSRAQESGARVLTGEAVTDIEVSSSRVRGVRLSSGGQISADVVVCAAGWRTPGLAALAGVSVPLTPADAKPSRAPCLVASTTPITPRPRRVIHAPHVHLRPAAGGGVLLEASDINARVELATSEHELRGLAKDLLERARAVWPALADARIDQAWRCVRPLPVDGLPIAGWPQPEGLYVAVTHSGVTLAPHLARLVSDELLYDQPVEALAPYRLDRFDPGQLSA